MNVFPLAPFLASLAADGIRLTLRDYERISLALHSAGEWSLPRLHDVLLALLAKDQAQQELFTRRFGEFFKLAPESGIRLSAAELDQVLAELKSLDAATLRQTKLSVPQPSRPRPPESPHQPPSRKKRTFLWLAATVVLILAAVLLSRMLSPPPPKPILHLPETETHFGSMVTGSTRQDSFSISNQGTAPLVIHKVAVARADSSHFRLARDYSGASVARDSSLQITVVCSARTAGALVDTLHIFSNDDHSPHQVTLRAVGLVLPPTEPVARRTRLYTDVPCVSDIAYIPLAKSGAWQLPALFAALAFLFTGCYAVYLWRSRKIPEDKPPVWDENKPRHFSIAAIGGKPEPRLDDATLDQLADAMGYFKTEQAGTILDVPASIAATGRNGGMPTLAFQRRKQMRALLVLEDAFAEPLAWNSIATELAEGMSRRGVQVVHGKFYGTPEQFKTAEGMLHRLEDLEDERRGYLLLLFTDGKSLSGHARAFALERLARWPMIAWIDLREPRFWEASASLPARFGIPLYPATPAVILPQQFETNLEAGLELWLGEALPWAQDCAMLQPMSLRLAEAVRRQFHPHLSPALIDRLLTLPGATRSAAAWQFSTEALRVLRRRFIVRRTEHEQEEVIRFLLAKIKAAKPQDESTPAHLAWEAVHERLRLELDPNDDLRRLGELAQTPLASSIRGSLEHFGFAEQADKIPLRVRPRNKDALQRLARLNDDLDIPKLKAYPIARPQWLVLAGSALAGLLCLLISLDYYSDPGHQPINWRIMAAASSPVRLERFLGERWQEVKSSARADLFIREPLPASNRYRLLVYGNGYHSTREFRVPPDTLVTLTLGSGNLDRPCREEYPEIGLAIESCRADSARSVRQKTWQETLGNAAPADRLLSVGLEISSGNTSENGLVQQVGKTLLTTSSVDVLYRLEPDRAGAWHFSEAVQHIQRDLGPVMQQSQLIWWATNPALANVVSEDSLSGFQRVLNLNQGQNRLFWTFLLNDIFAPGNEMVVTEDEIIRALNPSNPPRGAGVPVVLIRPVKPEAGGQEEQKPAAEITIAQTGVLMMILVFVPSDSAFQASLTLTLTLTNGDSVISKTFPVRYWGRLASTEITIGSRVYRNQMEIPLMEIPLPSDIWQATVTAAGYLPFEQSVTISVGDTQEVAAKLEPMKPDARATALTCPPGMVLIPSGRFLMGDNNGSDDEKPEHEVYIDAFCMDQTEVTVASYQRFLQATRYREPAQWTDQLKHPQFPVVYVRWEDANAYAEWRSQTEKQKIRLPTEAEWEYAARGGFTGLDGQPKYQYPWGNERDSTKANGDWDGTRGYEYDWKIVERYLRNVRSYPANGYGLYDMAGNVWEWCADWYDANYYQSSPPRNPFGPEKGDRRVLRGGSWINGPNDLRCAGRYWDYPILRYISFGFRCVQEAVR